MLTNYAMPSCEVELVNCKQRGTKERVSSELVTVTDDVTIELSGRYEFRVSEELLRDMEELGVINVAWLYDPKREKKSNPNFHLHKDLDRVIYRKLSTLSIGGKDHGCSKVVGFTTAVMITSSNERTIFYAHPCLQKHKRYDWAFVHFEEENGENYYACKLLGLISTDGNSCEVVIQCSVQPILWAKVEKNMLVKFTLGTDLNVSYVTVPVEAIVHPLCVIPDIGDDPNEYFVVLPKRNWSRLFGVKIRID